MGGRTNGYGRNKDKGGSAGDVDNKERRIKRE